MKVSTLFALGVGGASARHLGGRDSAEGVAQRASSDETPLQLGSLSGNGAAGVRLSIPVVQLPPVEKERRATSEETPLELVSLSGSGAAGLRVSIPVHISHDATTEKTKRASSEETPIELGSVSGPGAAGLRVSIPVHLSHDATTEKTKRATAEETPLELGTLTGSGSAGVRVNLGSKVNLGNTRRATSDETPLELGSLTGSGSAGVRVNVGNINKGNTKRAKSEEVPLELGGVSGAGAAGLRVNLGSKVNLGNTRRATSAETPLTLGDAVSGSGSAGLRVSVSGVNTVNARRSVDGESLLALGAVSGQGSAGVRLSFTSLHVPQDPALAKRATNGQTFTQNTLMYLIQASVGTPSQPLSLRLSTGSSDTWVPDSSQCRSSSSSSSTTTSMCIGGTFTKSNSSTFTRISSSWTSSYDDGSVSGERFSDALKVGSWSFPKAEMGLVDSSSDYVGVLGLGHNRSTSTTYWNFADALNVTGTIKSKAYSWWFSDASAKSGNILFGAVDKAKYTGELIRVPASASSGSSMVTLAEMVVGGNNVSRYDLPVRVTINPTDIVSELPQTIAQAIWKTVNATEQRTRTLVPCSKNSSTDVIKMRLSNAVDGPQFEATIGDLVLPEEIYRAVLNETTGSISTSSRANGTVMCLFGVQNSSFSSLTTTTSYSGSGSSSTVYRLGGGLLRRAYMVFDLHNREVAVAPVTFGDSSEQVTEFATAGATAPGAKLACGDDSYSSTIYSSFCSYSRSGGGSSGGGVDAWDNQNSDSGGFTGGLAVGIGVLIGLIVVGLVAFGVWFGTKRGLLCFGSKKDEADMEATQIEKGKGIDHMGMPPPMMMMSGAGHHHPAATAGTGAPTLGPIQETGPISGVSPISTSAQPVAHHGGHEHVTPPSVPEETHGAGHVARDAPAEVHGDSSPPREVIEPAHAEGSSSAAHPHAESSSAAHPAALTPGRAV